MSDERSYVFGIDLGTTYSCISYLKDGRPEVCQSMEGENTVPSVVRMLPEDGEPVAGRTAKDMAVIYPDHTMQFIKSKIGHVPTVEYGYEGEKMTTTPEAVSAEILKKLARDAAAYTNTEVKDVVITVPAYFGNNEREATREAGVQAGLNVIDIVEEPTAAAFYYGCEKSEQDEVICIFDLGGGTFDVTAMKMEAGSLRVLTTDGDHDLGGKKWDKELIDLVEEKFREQTGYDEEFDTDILQDLQLKCENAKKQLSSATSASVAINVDRKNKAQVTVTREEFDARTDYLLSSAIDLTREVFNRVEEKGHKIDKILLVGGSTFMPQVKERIQEEFGLVPELNEPNEAVSKGACIYCAWKILNAVGKVTETGGAGEGETEAGGDEVIEVVETDRGTKVITIGGEDGNTRVIELPTGIADRKIITVATKSFGIRVLIDGQPRIANLILKDTVLPVHSTNRFSTSVENQKDVKIELFQSEFYEADYDIEEGINIAESVLEGLPEGLPKHAPLDITITLTESGMIEITGKHNDIDLIGRLETNYSEGIGNQEE